MNKQLVIGTRGSQLALRQTDLVSDALRMGFDINPVSKIISTEGDRCQERSLRGTTGEGVFVREIEAALLRGEIDLAVHSLKDLPIEEIPGLKLAAFLRREDPREAFLSVSDNTFDKMPVGAVIGTSSLRRIVQLQKIRPDCEFKDIRGNIDTRLRKMEEGQYAGEILAMAGLNRLMLTKYIRNIFSLSECLPAPGQGVIALQIREDYSVLQVIQALQKLNDYPTERAVLAERSFLKQLGGGCRLPVGALATIVEESLVFFGMVSDSTGSQVMYHRMTGMVNEPVAIGARMADWFLKKGIIDWG